MKIESYVAFISRLHPVFILESADIDVQQVLIGPEALPLEWSVSTLCFLEIYLEG